MNKTNGANPGNDIRLNYESALILQTVLCQSCNKLIAFPGDVILSLTIEDLLTRAEYEHRKANPAPDFCVLPLLIVTYQMTQCSNALLQGLKK